MRRRHINHEKNIRSIVGDRSRYFLICTSPEIGEAKVGDLAGIRVLKFRFSRQEYLVAYRPPEKDTPMEFLIIDFYQVDSHENFYAELKHYLRQENSKGASK